MSQTHRVRLVWTLSVAMAAAATVVLVGTFGDLRDLDPPFTLPFPALLVAFVGAERLVVRLRIREDAMSTSLAELPLALALLFAEPAQAVLARALGTALALAPMARRSSLKYGFNVALLPFADTLAFVLHRGLVGTADPAGLRGWVALACALAVSHAATSALVAVAVVLTTPDTRVSHLLRVSMFGIAVTATLSVVAIFLSVATWHEPGLLALDVAAMLGIYALLRVYGTLSTQHEILQRLYEFSGDLTREPSVTGGARISLVEGASLLGASRGDLFVPWAGETVHWQYRFGEVQVAQRSASDRAIIAALAARGPLVLTLPDPGEPASDVLVRMGYESIVVAPLRGHDAVGWLAFDLNASERTVSQQLTLMANIAQQSETALGRSELVDRLRAEVDEREHRALHDPLTGLPNRTYFVQRISALANNRGVGEQFALLMIDLDRFKEVNDSLGHHYGDLLLQEITGRLRHHLRSTEFLARLGGDEFGLIVQARDATSAAARLAVRVASLLEEPVAINGTTIAVGGSIGISVCPRHSEDPATLLRQADIAMYAAKRDELPFVVYEYETEEGFLRRLQVLGRLRTVDLDEVVQVHFQPQIDLATGRVTGAEALARWHDPELGSVSPEEFVAVAEQSGLIRDLTVAVLRKALRGAAAWRRDGHDVRVGVNLSGRALLDLEVVDAVRTTLRATGLDPQHLLIEVTESVFVSDSQRLNEVLLAYQDLGAWLSIDDYGTGYSSLAYLRRLPAHELKIDRSFIDGMVQDRSKLAIVRSTVSLAHELGMHAVGEGIEDAETLSLLTQVGCDIAQGYHLGRPMPLADFRAFLQAHEPAVPLPSRRAVVTPLRIG